MAVPGKKMELSENMKEEEIGELLELICEPCKEDGYHSSAVGYCVNCCEHLCSQCYKFHRRVKPCRHHILQDETIMPKTKPQNKITSDKCPQHQDELVNFYCMSHDQLGCGICFATEHKKCEQVSYVEEEYEQLNKTLADLKQQFDINSDLAKKHVTGIKRNSSGAIANIKQFHAEVNKYFDELENDAINDVHTLRNEDQEKMSSVSALCDTVQGEIHAEKSDLAALQNTKQNGKLFKAMDKSIIQIKSFERRIHQIETDNKIRRYRFEPDKQIQELMNMKTVGRICPVKLFKEDINLKAPSKSFSCGITGITLLSGNQIIVVDKINSSVNLVDTEQNKITAELQLAAGDVTKMENNQAAITMPKDNKIQCLLISSDSMSKGLAIEVTGECWGIAYSEGILIVTFVNPGKLNMLNMTGTVLRNFELNGKPMYVSVSSDKNLYISDYRHDRVICMTMGGKVKAVYEDEDLRGVEGVTVNQSGTVFVCGRNSNNIHQITADCTRIQILLGPDEGICSPFSVQYCDADHKLYVGMWQSGAVKVFQIE